MFIIIFAKQRERGGGVREGGASEREEKLVLSQIRILLDPPIGVSHPSESSSTPHPNKHP